MSIVDHLPNSRGSEWRRWDPHIHAPGTLKNDQFGGRWEEYLQRIEVAVPRVEALGITDYFSLGTYEAVRAHKERGRLPEVQLLFPNVELRLEVQTAKQRAVNMHLLFSPEDADHVDQIRRALAHLTFTFQGTKYRCTPAELGQLGKAFSPTPLSEEAALREGANQFKVTLDNIREAFDNDRWLQRNCIVAVAGSNQDGTAGLQYDDAFAAARQEIERFAHVIFSSTPSQREFWLGKRPNQPPDAIRQTYGCLKLCMHGSDAHDIATVVAPANDRFCWIKGDAVFDALRHAVIEPEERSWIGPSAPAGAPPAYCIDAIRVTDAPFLHDSTVHLNQGIVAIIGARGSGKTALADMIAAAASSPASASGPTSFLHRASKPRDFLHPATASLAWADGTMSETVNLSLRTATTSQQYAPEVNYLSQHFVESLCSASGFATQLREEMERVIFESTPAADRLEATSFAELMERHVGPARRERAELRASILNISGTVTEEEGHKARLPQLREQREKLLQQLDGNRTLLKSLIAKGDEVRTQRLSELGAWIAGAEAKVQRLRRQDRSLVDLAARVKHIRAVIEPERFAAMKSEHAPAQLTDSQWDTFRLQFAGDVEGVIASARATITLAIAAAEGTDPSQNASLPIATADSPLRLLTAHRDALRKEIGADEVRQRRYSQTQQTIQQQEGSIRKLDADIQHAEGADERIKQARARRRAAYKRAVENVVAEEGALRSLYRPLHEVLSDARGALAKLQFRVVRHVDLDNWSAAGERLLDLRLDTPLRGQGALKRIAQEVLLDAWATGTPDEVAVAMDQFIERYWKAVIAARPASTGAETHVWRESVASWLFDTSHLAVQYTITYEDVAIEQLSPGTRGIVLLLLYLAVDRSDPRPLLIDQPEENLDPRSVFEELVPHFKEARKRRQIIIVTHNANLVVNTDVDQVIFTTSERSTGEEFPVICYQSGALEDPAMRRVVCQTLEGGEQAFRERERRYRLS